MVEGQTQGEQDKSAIDQLTPQEQLELQEYLTGTAPIAEEKHNIHKFLHDIATSDDTTKTGYLLEEEIGSPLLPVRTLKELALFCSDIAGMKDFASYFQKESEIVTSTSLSKNAKLIELAVVSRRELGDVTDKPPKKNKGWFSKKGGKE